MNKKKLMLNVCKSMLDGNKRLYGCFINPSEFAVTTTGHNLYIFNAKECVFDIAKIHTSDELCKVCNDDEKDEQITKTKKVYECRGKTLDEYKGENFTLYADRAVTSIFKDYSFFANGATSRVLVKDCFGRLVGVFLPVLMTEKELMNI